jgi:hypothetical protein
MRRIRGCELGRSTGVAGLTGPWFMIRSDPSLHISNQYLQQIVFGHDRGLASQSLRITKTLPIQPPAAAEKSVGPSGARGLEAGQAPRLSPAAVGGGTQHSARRRAAEAHCGIRGACHKVQAHSKSPPRPPTTLGGAGMASCNGRAQQEPPTPIQTSNSATQPRGCSRTLSAAVARVPSGLSLTVTPTHTGQQNKVATDWQSIGASPTPGPAREKKTRPLRRPWRPYSIFGRLVSGIGNGMFGALFS